MLQPPRQLEPPAPTQAPAVQLGDMSFIPWVELDDLEARVAELAASLNKYYLVQEVVLAPVLSGSLRFMASLLPQLQFPWRLAPLKYARYGASTNPQHAALAQLSPAMQVDTFAGLPLLLIEDILDTGLTVQRLLDDFAALEKPDRPKAVQLVSLLRKPSIYRGPEPLLVGFDIPPVFVVGYGLDYAEQGRGLAGLYGLQAANP